MSLRFSVCCSGAASFLMLILALALDGRAAETPHGRPIEFSDPKSTDIATNLNQLNSRRSGLRDLEDDLKSFQQSLFLRGSLDGVGAPQMHPIPTPTIRIKQVKELLERNKNWAFRNP